jgi:hypothetical protein
MPSLYEGTFLISSYLLCGCSSEVQAIFELTMVDLAETSISRLAPGRFRASNLR